MFPKLYCSKVLNSVVQIDMKKLLPTALLVLLLILRCYKDELYTSNADNEMSRPQISALNCQITLVNIQIATPKNLLIDEVFCL